MTKLINQTAEERLFAIKKLGISPNSINQIKAILVEFPDFISGWLELGIIYRELGDRELALNSFQIAKKLDPNNQKVKLELSIEQLHFNQLVECRNNIQELLEKEPNNVWAIMRLGEIARKENKRSEALKFFRQALELSPQMLWTNINFAIELANSGRVKQAEQQLKKALAYYPNEINILFQLGKLARQQQNGKQALQYFQKSVEIAPQNLWANINLAIELSEHGDFTSAEKYLKLALKYHPLNFNALMQTGQLECKRKNWHLALKYFQQVIENYPTRIEAYFSKLDILCNLEKFAEAQKQLEILRQIYPDNTQVLLQSGHSAKKLGQRNKALQWFSLAQAKANNPERNLEARILVIEELGNLGRLAEAIELINDVIQEFPHHIPAKLIKANLLGQKLDFNGAAEIYRAILALEPNHLKSRLKLAQIYSQSGQIKTAINLLEQSYRLLGANIHIFLKLGAFYEALADWEIAGQWYQKACQEYPLNPHGYCKLAHLMFIQGATESAIKLLQETQAKIPDSSSVVIKLIECHISMGDLELSHQLLSDALHRFPHNYNLLWQVCRVYMQQGEYTKALKVLDQVDTDNQDWIRQTEKLRANIYFYLYNYQQAEKHFQQAISLASIATEERNRLATILMLTGRINEARHQLKIATKELTSQTPLGQTLIPLKGHPAMVTNQLRTNPLLMTKLQAIQKETGSRRIIALGHLLTQEPNYLGTALYLARELRTQGIFDNLQLALCQSSQNMPLIPRRIMQFWDQPQPPKEVIRTCQSWIERNSEFEYIRFSRTTAVAFLKEHYDQRVLQAFANCEQPATQSDFFRLAYLNKMGGFYADVDDLCCQSLNNIINLNPELIVLQEDFACIGNNFLGCIPGQTMITAAFYQAVDRLSYYCNDSPWFKTGPGLMTSAVCGGLLPYLNSTDYQSWPRLLVLTQAQLRKIVNQHLSLPYKRTAKNWQHNAYQQRTKVISSVGDHIQAAKTS